jgi:predicted enzyme related to lactoylglutathione lyase
MKFGYTIIYVPNVANALNFYQKAFGFEISFLHESQTYGELATGTTTLAFAAEEMREFNGIETLNNRLENTSCGIEIAFVTNNIENSFKKALDAGAILVKKPTQKPWGQIVAYVKDINGVLIELCTPVT